MTFSFKWSQEASSQRSESTAKTVPPYTSEELSTIIHRRCGNTFSPSINARLRTLRSFEECYQPAVGMGCPRRESDLVIFLRDHFFRPQSEFPKSSRSGFLPFDEWAIEERTDYTSRFH